MAISVLQTNKNSGAGSSTTITTSLTGITAGSLVCCMVKHEGGAAGTVTVSDGTTSFTVTAWGSRTGNPAFIAFAYLLSANSGDKTLTATYSTGVPFRAILAFEVAADGGTWALNGTTTFGSGTGTAVSSGNITTTSTHGIAFGGYGPVSGAVFTVTPTINSVTAGTYIVEDFSAMWSHIFSAGFTGAAAGTLDISQNWTAGVIGFDSAVAGGGATSPAAIGTEGTAFNGGKTFVGAIR